MNSNIQASNAALYDERYATHYPDLYIRSWGHKHKWNESVLEHLLGGLPGMPSWLDVACGQAWHFSRFPGRARMVGLDASLAQLAVATATVPEAEFLCGDMSTAMFPARSFDLITSFWGAYCYLGSASEIEGLVRRTVQWLRPGGSLYFEVLLGQDLLTFGASRFAQRTGFHVVPLDADCLRWAYVDRAGRHEMYSPPLSAFKEWVSSSFETVEATHDGAFMVHLVCKGRRPD